MRKLSSWAGGLPAATVLWGVTAAFSAWIVCDVAFFGASDGLQRATYDSMVRARLFKPAPDPRIVVVDIDEPSLAKMSGEFGRWPWPRDTLATVMSHLQKQGAAAIAWDVLMLDPDRLHPGGDAAFDEAAKHSPASHFGVVRLPASADAESSISASMLPGLWVDAKQSTARISVIPPFLPNVAAGHLGYSNNEPERDGVLRRYRFGELLPDGSVIRSMALSIASSVEPAQARKIVERLHSPFYPPATLIAWRGADAYPRVPFWQVFDEAEHRRSSSRWAGKVVLVGSTAPGLHDYHPSPLAPHHAGVLILANAVDNALHGEQPAELPAPLLAAFAIAICTGIALWAQFRSVASLDPLLIALPAVLLAASYASLHGAPVFLELQWAAALALTFLAILRIWVMLRRAHWCSPPAGHGELMVWPLARHTPWVEAVLDRLIDVVERHAPACRIVVPDAVARWPAPLRWPELARHAAIVGPADAIGKAHDKLRAGLRRLGSVADEPVAVPRGTGRDGVARLCMKLWGKEEDR